MGQLLDFICIDCKKVYHVGYGRPKEWESYKTLEKEHESHKHQDLWMDYLRVRGNDLVSDHPYKSELEDEVVIENYVEFEMVGFDRPKGFDSTAWARAVED